MVRHPSTPDLEACDGYLRGYHRPNRSVATAVDRRRIHQMCVSRTGVLSPAALWAGGTSIYDVEVPHDRNQPIARGSAAVVCCQPHAKRSASAKARPFVMCDTRWRTAAPVRYRRAPTVV